MQNHFLLEKSETHSLPSYVQKDCIQGALGSHPGGHHLPPSSGGTDLTPGTSFLICSARRSTL